MSLLTTLYKQPAAAGGSGYPLLPYITAPATVFDGIASTVYEDSALTTPVGWGGAQPLGGVDNILGAQGVSLIQTTSNVRPYVTSDNYSDPTAVKWFEDGSLSTFRHLSSQLNLPAGAFTLACVFMRRAPWSGGGQEPSLAGAHLSWDSDAFWCRFSSNNADAGNMQIDIDGSWIMNAGPLPANYTSKAAFILRRDGSNNVTAYTKSDATAALPWASTATDNKAGGVATPVKTCLDFYGDRSKKAFWFFMQDNISDAGLVVLQQRMKDIATAWVG